jgi:hypothetical protein
MALTSAAWRSQASRYGVLPSQEALARSGDLFISVI